ncbi:MAG: GNAT family N-acetyltransferase [Clostridiales bacterium]|nr:GNAT family N-acetyltransferase [Clostridiales bacterium]
MVRPMKPEDREAVLDIVRATGMFTAIEIQCAEEQIDIFLGQPGQQDYSLVVAENDKGQVVGYMSYGPTPLAEGAYDIYWMAVAPGVQGRGHGRKLVSWLEDRVKDWGGRLILIETSSQPKYERTRRFYLSLEYREVARIPDFYKPGDDRITYAKYLESKERN